MKTIAIILAGGEGQRFSNKIPKQFLCISGKPILYYTIEKFHSIKEIDEIVLVSHKMFVNDVKQVVNEGQFCKVKYIIEGGKSRQDSTYNALNLLQNYKDAKILIHDGVRPLVTETVIKACITALDIHPACAVATSATDTIFEVCENKIINIPDRKKMYLAQTPQGFRLALIQEAYRKLKTSAEPHLFSDDCGIFMHYLNDVYIHVVEGNRENIKLTYPQDEIYIKESLNK